MKKMLSLGVVAGLLTMASAVWAYPSLLGPTGGANLPLATVVERGVAQVAVDKAFLSNQDDSEARSDFAIRALYGVAKNTEIGVTYNDNKTTNELDEQIHSGNWGVNAKYLLPLNVVNTAFAVGGVYQKYDETFLNLEVEQFYGVATHS
ncbi:MAG TPA: hypothetical protein VGL77_12790, partial [Armatimonadota bacterium]